VLSIQEHRMFHPDTELEHSDLGKNKLIIASAWKNSQGLTIGGIGIILSQRSIDNLFSLSKVSNQIIIAEFKINPKTTFFACYSPTNVSEQADVDTFILLFLRLFKQSQLIIS